MTAQEKIKALPEEERVKFFRALMPVVDAGYAAGVSPIELAKMYAETCTHIETMLKENAK
jgi:hypothetical protein